MSQACSYSYVCVYIYIYSRHLLIKYLPVITVSEKNKKPLPRNKRKKISLVTVQRKKKKVFWVKKKEKTNLVLLLEKNQGVLSQWPKENQKTLREYCNAIITKVLNIKQWSQYRTCNLCMEEKLFIADCKSKNMLNKRSEVFNSCKHKRAWLLYN